MSSPPDSLDAEIVATIDAARRWIGFNEKTHRYTVRGTSVPSVTGIIDSTMSKPALISWAARMQREADLGVLYKAVSDGHGLGVVITHLEHSKADAHNQIKEAAGDLGTEIHHLIEQWCARTGGFPEPAPQPVSDDAAFVFSGWEKWAADVNLQPLMLEQRVAHERLMYAGKFDFLGYCEGRLAVIDWKSSRAIYDSHVLQGVAYVKAVAEMGLPEPEAMVVRLPKDGTEKAIQPVWIDGDYDDHFDVFASLLKTYRWRQKVDKWLKSVA